MQAQTPGPERIQGRNAIRKWTQKHYEHSNQKSERVDASSITQDQPLASQNTLYCAGTSKRRPIQGPPGRRRPAPELMEES
jgi:hypothetical protein